MSEAPDPRAADATRTLALAARQLSDHCTAIASLRVAPRLLADPNAEPLPGDCLLDRLATEDVEESIHRLLEAVAEAMLALEAFEASPGTARDDPIGRAAWPGFLLLKAAVSTLWGRYGWVRDESGRPYLPETPSRVLLDPLEVMAIESGTAMLERLAGRTHYLAPGRPFVATHRGVMPYIGPEVNAMRAGADGQSIYIGDTRHEVDEAGFIFVSEVLNASPGHITYAEIRRKYEFMPEIPTHVKNRLPVPVKERIVRVEGFQYQPASM